MSRGFDSLRVVQRGPTLGQQPVQQAVPVQQPQPVAAQPPAPSGPAVPNMIITSPAWVFIVRVFQVLISLIIVGLCGFLMRGAYAAGGGPQT